MSGAFYWGFTRFCKYTVLPLYARVRIHGLENVPPTGPLVLVSNHLNDGDPGILATQFPRRIVYMAKIELYKIPGLAQFMRAYDTIPVRRNEADLSALRRAAQKLEEGLCVGIFPEGGRSGSSASMREAWPGAAMVALRNNTPVIPVAITGSQHLAMPGIFLRPFRRHDVDITVGEPFLLERPARLNGEAVRAATDLIMRRVAALLPESYRGYYGNDPLEGAPSETPGATGEL